MFSTLQQFLEALYAFTELKYLKQDRLKRFSIQNNNCAPSNIKLPDMHPKKINCHIFPQSQHKSSNINPAQNCDSFIDFFMLFKIQLFLSIIIMSTQQQDQQVTFKYLFTIIPLQIKSNSKIKANTSKAILIKLGNKTAKCTQMNTPLDLEIDVLYSRTLQKYCPIKGIIKIYDVSEDGAQIISCVGGFQTDQLLNEGKNNVIIEKELGTSKLKMEINIVNKSEKRSEDRSGIIPRQNSSKQSSNSREKNIMGKKSPNQRPSVPPSALPSAKNALKSSQISSNQTRRNSQMSEYAMKGVEIPYKNTSTNINKSLQKISQALNFKQRFQENPISTKANEVLGKAELQNLKQQINDQKRRTQITEEKLSKANSKLNQYRSALNTLQNDIKSNIDIFSRIINQLDLKDGKLQQQITQTTKTISIKYSNKRIERTLKQFIETALKKVKQFVLIADLQAQSIQRGTAQLEQLRKEVGILKKLTTQKDKKIYSLEKGQQGMQQTIQNLKKTNRDLSEQNGYLREKNDQIQLTLYRKENQLQSLRKQTDKYAQDINELENRLYNSGLQNEQLREQVDQCNETIQQYRQKYGDLKNVKNRAIEMQIKECIRWIDQQNRDLQMSEMEQTMQSEMKDERDDSLSSVIRNLEIEKVPVQQMSIIRDELMCILRKIDNLMTK